MFCTTSSGIAPAPELMQIMGKFKNGTQLTDDEKVTFGKIW